MRLARIAQAVFERASGATGGSSIREADRVDCALVRELRMIHAIENARTVAAYQAWITTQLGPVDAPLLRRVLRDGVPFKRLADDGGRPGRYGTAYYADRVRDALEHLAHALAARGKARAVVRGIRLDPVPGEEFDRAGCLVAPGEGYRVGADPEHLSPVRSTPAPGAAASTG